MTLAKDAETFLSMTGRIGTLLGLDPGTKTIGVAVSDERRTLASPLETVWRNGLRHDLERLRLLAERREATGLVLGMPLNMDGTAGRRAQSVRAFSRSVEEALGLPVLHWDERLSTAAAEDAMIAADLSRAKRAERVDALAAASILQGALDAFAGIAARDASS